MKKLINLLSLFIVLVFFLACSPPAPENIFNAFNEKYPDAQDVEWEMEDENEWEVEFELDGKEFIACFDEQGQWLETEMEVSPDQLPGAVTDILTEVYPEYKISESEWTENPEFKGYELEIESDNPLDDTVPVYDPNNHERILEYEIIKKANEYEILIEENGKLFSVEAEEEDEEGDDEDDDDDEDGDEDDD